MSALIRRATVDELAAHRGTALRLYAEGLDTLQRARKAHALAAPRSHITDWPDDMGRRLRWDGPEKIVTELTASVDRDMWRYLIDATSLGSMMDREERQRFEVSLRDAPPEATPESMLATVERLTSEAGTIFIRGLVNAFARFCRDYKSNDGFKIGERVVVEGGVTWDIHFGKFRLNYYKEPDLMDLDRVVRVLHGQPAPTYEVGLCASLRTAFETFVTAGGRKPVTTLETDHWRARWFKKGTLHLAIRDDDVRRRANRMIAEHYGEALPEGHDVARGKADPEAAAQRYDHDDRDYFPTPASLAADLVQRAEIGPEMRVLEPSAGHGAIVRALAGSACEVVAIEIDERREAQFNHGEVANFFGPYRSDFLCWPANPEFDRVVMNPPFSRNQDALHILHALKFLAPGGRLVALAGAGLSFRADRIAQACRTAIAAWGGTIEPLPNDSFAESGTHVRTVVITVDRLGDPA